jgi:hypothetical protein
MSTSIKLKKSSISGRIPSLSDLDYGELAINYTDGVLYYKNSSNAIQKISGNAIGVDSDAVFAIIDSDYIQLRQDYSYSSLTGTPNILDSADVSLIAGSVSGLDSSGVRTLVDSAYVQARQTAQDFAYSSLTGAPNVLDSADVALIVDSAYIQARQADIFRDSAFVTNIVDTAYIQARDRIRDSNFVQDIVDSAYVQLRQTVQDFAYSSLTGAPNVLDSADVALIAQANDTTRDSAFVTNIIDSAYIQLRDTPQDFAYSSLTGAPTAVSSFTNDANYLDSTTVQGVIDASYIQSNQITYNTSNFVDSAFVTAQIDALIDGAPGTLDTLNEIAAALNDDDSAYTTLVNLINAKSDLDSADVVSIVDSAYVALRVGDFTVSDISDLTATATELNYLDGVTGITLGSANELLVVGGDGSSIVSNDTLAVDTSNNRLGINQSSPEVTLHMTGEGAQTAQIRMEQYNDNADAPDLRTRRYRGTIASPSAISSGDYLYRSNHEYWNGSALIVGGTFAFDNTNNANRTQFAVSVTTDGTSADANTPSKTQFKIDGNDGGAITFNNAYKFPTSDGTNGQVLTTDGLGSLSFQNAAGNIDSADVVSIIDSAVDQSFINNLDVNAGTLDGQDGTYFLDYNNFTNTPTAADFRDSAFVESIASQTTSPADSASVAAIVDSAFIQTLVKEDYVATIVDSAYVALRVGDFAENFGTVAVVGDLSIDATTGGDTITLQGGTGVDISSDVGNKRITISATPSTVYDFGTIAAPVQFTLDMGAI